MVSVSSVVRFFWREMCFVFEQMRAPAQLEFFSLGGVLSYFWHSRSTILPYVLTAFVLSVLSCWDLMRGAGRADFIMLGLAAYELTLGLTE